MPLRNQQIVNDCTTKADPIIVTALCKLNDEIVGLRHENKMLAETMHTMIDTIKDLTDGMGGIGNVVDQLTSIREGDKTGIEGVS